MMAAVPGASAHASPFWLTYITKGLLDTQVPLDPEKLLLSNGRTTPSL